MRTRRRRLTGLRPREAAVFAALTDAYCAPGGRLPSVLESDAAVFIDGLAAASPRVNRVGLRLLLRLVDLAPLARGYGRRFRSLDSARRERFLHELDMSRLLILRAAARLLKTVTLMSYWGDPRVLRAAGFDPRATIARGREVRTREGRP